MNLEQFFIEEYKELKKKYEELFATAEEMKDSWCSEVTELKAELAHVQNRLDVIINATEINDKSKSILLHVCSWEDNYKEVLKAIKGEEVEWTD